MRIRTPTDLGAVIRDTRRQRGLDQQTLAQRIGVSRQWVIEVEKGKSRAEVGLVLRALDALGVHLTVRGAATEAGSDPALGIDIDQIVDEARDPDA
jgi:HTH-type transcriptional regulator/antitoxin HipB